MALYTGCPIWGEKRWVGNFFPAGTKQKDFLAVYSRRLNTVEGNTSFYAVPSEATVQHWRDTVPPGFKFCFKFPQTISHNKRLRDAVAETEEWMLLMRLLADRAGPSFLQLPPSFAPDQIGTLAEYLSGLPHDLQFAVEVRHPAWFVPETEAALNEMLTALGIGRVLFDVRGLRASDAGDAATVEAQDRKPRVPVRTDLTAPFTLVRYIANPEIEANTLLLEMWAETVADWLRNETDVYFFLHHPDNFYAPVMCREFYAHISAKIEVPPLPDWSEPDLPPLQQTMF